MAQRPAPTPKNASCNRHSADTEANHWAAQPRSVPSDHGPHVLTRDIDSISTSSPKDDNKAPSLPRLTTIDGGKDAVILPYTPFSPAWKKVIIAITSVASMLNMFIITSFLPTLAEVKHDLDSTTSRINIALAMYTLFQGIGSMIWGRLADQFGRRISFSLSCLICALSSVGCAVAQSDSVLITMHLLQSVGSSSVVVVSAGIVGDLYVPEERGRALGFIFGTQLIGSISGTFTGGYITESLSWRWTFWIIAIISGILFLLTTFVLPETHRIIVARKRRINLRGLPMDLYRQSHSQLRLAHFNPLAIAPALRFKYVWIPTLVIVLIDAGFFSLNAVLTTVLTDQYHYSSSRVGLCYLAQTFGNIVGSIMNGYVTDCTYQRAIRHRETSVAHQLVTERTPGHSSPHNAPLGRVSFDGYTALGPDGFAPYEARLLFTVISLVMFPLALITWAWCAQYTISVATLLSMQFLVGFSWSAGYGGLSIYLIDVFTTRSSSITSLANLFGNLYAALWAGVIQQVRENWGTGWAFSFLGFTSIVGSVAVAWLYLRGEKWRQEKPPPAFELVTREMPTTQGL